MATIEALTDKLLQAKIGTTLPYFIHSQAEMGNDVNGITAALVIATGELYDKRTVQRWIDVYGASR